MARDNSETPVLDVLIVGAGLSGIGSAWHLKKRCPDFSFAILEARKDMGGTWDLFRYPGIRSDSDMYTFGYNFRPWTDGSVFADGHNIKSYIKATASEAGIEDHVRYGQKVVAYRWDSQAALWTVETKTRSGEKASFQARYVIMSTGYYSYDSGYKPDFPGQSNFRGEWIHPQHWPEDLDYSDKKVVVIGSGATAVTLVPAMAEKAGHVTMLQRSPTYIAAFPTQDGFANFTRKILPGQTAYMLTRMKNIVRFMLVYWLSRTFPDFVKNGVMKEARKALGEDYPVEKHFAPSYKPWDQRFCVAPDGDFFEAIKSGKASVATDHIETITESGIRLKSGEEIEADIIVSATGLVMQVAGGAKIEVDGEPYVPSQSLVYRGMMLSGVPNLTYNFGYTNAPWTLKIDLTNERTCKLLSYMKKHGHDFCVPTPPEDLEVQPILDFSSGYVQRALDYLPKQGATPPWQNYQNYFRDMMSIRYGKIDDGHLKLAKAGEFPSRTIPTALLEAAE